MSVRVYRLCEGENRLSEHFTAADFACRDGSAEVPVADELIDLLEKLYRVLKLSRIHIAAGYRSPSYARRIGRQDDICHLDGRGADIICRDGKGQILSAKTVLCTLEGMGHKGGAGYMSPQCVHVDVGEKILKFDGTDGGRRVESFCRCFGQSPVNPYAEPARTLRRGDRGEGVKWLQTQLNGVGFRLDVDGVYGDVTRNAVIKFQEKAGLIPDGTVAVKTRAALIGILKEAH